MINNIYELENGRQYIVVAEENINNKKYVLVMECNYDKDEINDEDSIKKLQIQKEMREQEDDFDSERRRHCGPCLHPADKRGVPKARGL